MTHKMTRLSLSGRELAELYALQMMGIPSDRFDPDDPDLPDDPNQNSFLFDTREGRDILADYANDLSERIRGENDSRIQNYIDAWDSSSSLNMKEPDEVALIKPDDSDLAEKAWEFLEEQATNAGLMKAGFEISESDQWWSSDQLPFRFDATNGMFHNAQAIPEPKMKELDDLMDSFTENIGNELDDQDLEYELWEAWKISKWRNDDDEDEAFKEFKSILDVFSRSPRFLEPFWTYELKQNYDKYNKEYKALVEPDENQVRDEVFEHYAGDEHILIDQMCDELDKRVDRAERTMERDDYVMVMEQIDLLSSMSHHGGPAFEYAESSPRNEPDLFEIMNRKFGDRFIPWLIASGNFPEEYLPELQRWYDEQTEKEGSEAYWQRLIEQNQDPQSTGRAIDRKISRDDYYKHPYFSQRNRWLAQHSPTFQSWTPFDEELEDEANVQSVGRAMRQQEEDYSPRGDVMRAFLDDHGGYSAAERSNIIDPSQLRPRWNSGVEANTIRRMTRLANRIDGKGHHRIADRIDLFIRSLFD